MDSNETWICWRYDPNLSPDALATPLHPVLSFLSSPVFSCLHLVAPDETGRGRGVNKRREKRGKERERPRGEKNLEKWGGRGKNIVRTPLHKGRQGASCSATEKIAVLVLFRCGPSLHMSHLSFG